MRNNPARRNFLSLGPHGFHRIAYTEWGASTQHVVVCVHGLTRNARDFDWLADSLYDDCRVVCMDVAGRGESEWLEHKQDYTFRLYQNDAAALVARLTDVRSAGVMSRLFGSSAQTPAVVDWVGTSMGGLIGILLAAQPRSPIRRLVLNDVGPFIPWAALMRMKGYALTSPRYATFEAAEARLRAACNSWGPIGDDQWRHLAQHSIVERTDGTYSFACDPRIADATAWGFSPDARVGTRNLLGMELWSEWSRVQCPVLVVRGKQSDVLLPTTVDRMCGRDVPTEVVEFDGIGHAPSLMQPAQIDAVRRFLLN